MGAVLGTCVAHNSAQLITATAEGRPQLRPKTSPRIACNKGCTQDPGPPAAVQHLCWSTHLNPRAPCCAAWPAKSHPGISSHGGQHPNIGLRVQCPHTEPHPAPPHHGAQKQMVDITTQRTSSTQHSPLNRGTPTRTAASTQPPKRGVSVVYERRQARWRQYLGSCAHSPQCTNSPPHPLSNRVQSHTSTQPTGYSSKHHAHNF